MNFRSRLFLAFCLATLVPLGMLAYGVRREMTRRLGAGDEARAASIAGDVREDLTRESVRVAERLAALAADLREDNRFRLAAAERRDGARGGLLDLAAGAMRLSGLSLLQIQDSAGRILSSGHFRNEYDRLQPELPRALRASGGTPAIVRVRTGAGPLLALARVDSFTVADRRFTLAGGVAFDQRLVRALSRAPGFSVALGLPSTAADSSDVVAQIPLTYIDLLSGAVPRPEAAWLVVTRTAGTLAALRRSIDRWFLAALAVTVGLALIAAAWLSARISRPLTALAAETARIDLDRLDQRFASDRDDEIGALAGVLGAMTERLRLGAARLREAERRVATGDLARQVNHDVKNGLVPIRNVLRHLAQVARDEPASLARVFQERRGTLESSLDYLDTLARNYARLSPAVQRVSCNVNAVVEEVVRGTASAHATLRAAPAAVLPSVPADPLVLRRILENLVGNAVDSVSGRSDGVVTVGTERVGSPAGGGLVRLTVADTGPGMSRAELDRAFDDFHTTKAGGTGLGLSIVRRLVLDLGGALRIETAPGAGTRAIVELPVDGGTPGIDGGPAGAEGRRG